MLENLTFLVLIAVIVIIDVWLLILRKKTRYISKRRIFEMLIFVCSILLSISIFMAIKSFS